MCFRIQELQQEVHQLQEKLAMMESGLRDYNKQVGFLFICIVGIESIYIYYKYIWVIFDITDTEFFNGFYIFNQFVNRVNSWSGLDGFRAILIHFTSLCF